MRSRLIRDLFLLSFLLLGACASEGDDDDDDFVCQQGATQGCVCPGGGNGGQACDDNAWGTCECDGNQNDCTNGSTQSCTCAGGDSGSQSCAGGSWQGCVCEGGGDEPVIGDPCFDQSDCDGSDLELFCVLENGGDVQGICTIACGDFSDCLGDPVPAFYDCCDLANGSLACAPDGWECEE
jgi:hypothetical protein